MTGEKRTETRMRCYNTLCIPYISLHDPPYSHIQCMHAGRGGVIYREYTECYSISFLFLFFFHQSSLYPIKIFAKCFYLLVIYTIGMHRTQLCGASLWLAPIILSLPRISGIAVVLPI